MPGKWAEYDRHNVPAARGAHDGRDGDTRLESPPRGRARPCGDTGCRRRWVRAHMHRAPRTAAPRRPHAPLRW
eukprot:1266831-Prymnesium_polylepis.2